MKVRLPGAFSSESVVVAVDQCLNRHSCSQRHVRRGHATIPDGTGCV